jgi:4'-phosphopantetheinyl transferase EntD
LIEDSQRDPPADLLAGLFTDGVHFSAANLHDCAEELVPAERELVQKVSSKRRQEIATGRKLARQLLCKLGHSHFALLRDKDRVPLWPANVVGCISHKEPLCVVAIAPKGEWTGLGLDIEPDEAPRPGLERMIAGPAERLWIAAAGPTESGRRCRAIFSAKEAVYKAFYPQVREPWSFNDVEISIDFRHEGFVARLPASAGRRLAADATRVVEQGFAALDRHSGELAFYSLGGLESDLVKDLTIPSRAGPLIIPSVFTPLVREIFAIPEMAALGKGWFFRDGLQNLVGFIPLGFLIVLLRVARNRGSGPKAIGFALLWGGSLSIGIEAVQVFLPMRSSSAIDLALNIFGTGLGAISALWLVRVLPSGRASPVE